VKRNIPLGNMTTHFTSSFKLMQKHKVFPVQATKAHMGRRVTAPLILILGTRWRRLVNFMPWPHTPRKQPWYPLNRRLGKPQSQSGHFLSVPGFKPEPSSLQQVTIPNIVLQLLLNYQFNTRIQIGQMQPVACQFDMPVVHAAIAGLFTKVVILVTHAVI